MIFSLKWQRWVMVFVALILAVLFRSTVKSQTWRYTAENHDYVLTLPSPQWRAVDVSSVAHANTEFHYGDQDSVHLRIRRELLDLGITRASAIERQKKMNRASLRGYVTEKIERFEGPLSGAKYAYEYISAGKQAARLIYYLQPSDRVIYRLEFSGPADELRNISNQAEFIARSFRVQ